MAVEASASGAVSISGEEGEVSSGFDSEGVRLDPDEVPVWVDSAGVWGSVSGLTEGSDSGVVTTIGDGSVGGVSPSCGVSFSGEEVWASSG